MEFMLVYWSGIMGIESLINKSKQSGVKRYNHASLERRRRTLRFLLKWIGFTTLAKLGDVEGLENVPGQGPAILMINHIAFIDSIVVLHVVPRNIVPLAKIEVYNYPVIGWFPKLYGVIPVRREEVDRRAVQQCLEVLKAGEIILVAPEGTRGTELQRGKEGVAFLAVRGGVPIVPTAIEGTPEFPALRFTSPWRGPGVKVRFGRPFLFRTDLRNARHEQLRLMTDEAMYVLAAMLPPQRRGVYSDLSEATQDTIEWL
jgi:1-acyl-sn-glycerol-3-phosphate acyltransferase